MRLQYAKAAKPPEGLEAPKKPDLENELVALIVDLTFLEDQPPLRDADAFHQRLDTCKPNLMPQAQQTVELIRQVLDAYQKARKALANSNKLNWMASVSDIQQQLDRLVFQGFLQQIPYLQLQHYPRYLKAIQLRLDKLQHAAPRDQQRIREIQPLLDQWQAYDQRLRKDRRGDERIDEIRWMLEELRISLFAQEVGTAYPVSVKRVERRWREMGL